MNSPERDAALELAHLIIASDKIGIVLLSGEDKQLVARQLLALHKDAALYRKALTLRPMDSFQENDTILALCKRDNEFYRVQFAWTENGGRQFMCDMDLPRFAEHELEGGILSNDLAALSVRGEK